MGVALESRCGVNPSVLLCQVFQLPLITKIGGPDKALPLHEIMRRLKNTYCGTMGAEYMFIQDRQKCESSYGQLGQRWL